MTKNRKNTIPVLIDIKYAHPMNRFEEFYGDCVTYADVEQESYIDLKNMIFEKICPDIKFRKFNRENNTLTVKADMINSEFTIFKDISEGKRIDERATKDKKNNPNGEIIIETFNFFHDFKVSNIKIMTKEDLLRCKKPILEEDQEYLDMDIRDEEF